MPFSWTQEYTPVPGSLTLSALVALVCLVGILVMLQVFFFPAITYKPGRKPSVSRLTRHGSLAVKLLPLA